VTALTGWRGQRVRRRLLGGRMGWLSGRPDVLWRTAVGRSDDNVDVRLLLVWGYGIDLASDMDQIPTAIRFVLGGARGRRGAVENDLAVVWMATTAVGPLPDWGTLRVELSRRWRLSERRSGGVAAAANRCAWDYGNGYVTSMGQRACRAGAAL